MEIQVCAYPTSLCSLCHGLGVLRSLNTISVCEECYGEGDYPDQIYLEMLYKQFSALNKYYGKVVQIF